MVSNPQQMAENCRLATCAAKQKVQVKRGLEMTQLTGRQLPAARLGTFPDALSGVCPLSSDGSSAGKVNSSRYGDTPLIEECPL